jgi:type II secretory pathway pseudopilin PulG
MCQTDCRCERGFSLIEVVVAAGLLAASLMTLAQLFVLGMQSNLDSRRTTEATVLAQQKLEELRALAWGFDEHRIPISDTTSDTAAEPVQPTGGTGLRTSPSSALQANTPGFVDYVDRFGRKLGGGASLPPGAMFTRRWSVQPLSAQPGATLVFQVLVTPHFVRGGADEGAVARLPGEARVVTVKTRKPR